MSMNNYASFADTVEESFVKEQCPETFQNLTDALDEANVSLMPASKVFCSKKNVINLCK